MIKTVNQYPISDVFSNQNNAVYRIPKYQREYTWGIKDWDALFDDVIDNEEGYFLGSFICVSTSSLGTSELEIIDGQQRFTSVALLLAALYAKLAPYKENGELDDDESTDFNNLRNAIANRKTTREGTKKVTSYTPKLILQDQYENRADFESILAENNIIDFRKKPNYRGLRRIEKAYRHFKKCIEQHVEKSIEENPDLLETDVLFDLAQKFKSVVLVGIEVDNHKDAYMLFESLNHRGVPLSAIDLIKNILIAQADGYGRADECYTQWKEALNNIGNDYSVQERFMRQYYNAFREELNTPFLSEDTSKRFPLAYKATRTTLLDIYEKLIRKDYNQFMEDFMTESAYYSIIVNNSEEKKPYVEELADLERIQGAPSYLLLLYLLTKQNELTLSDDDIKSIIKMLIIFFVRRNVTDIPATRNLDRIFMDIVAAVKVLKGQAVCQEIKRSLMEESAPDDIFDHKLRGPMYEENDMATRFVLCGIESQHQTREIYSDFWSRNKSGVYVWTIEHIFPEGQNIPDEWVKMIADGDKTIANNYRETYVHTLGNLTLTGYNQNLSNMSFEKKKDRMDKSNTKYIGYRNGLVLNEDVVSEETWTVDKIKERTNKLVEIIKSIYSWS